jgi:hypothetical protein
VRLPRMTTRRWMIAVAVVAVAMGGIVGARAVWQYFVALNRIQYHAGMEHFWHWLTPTEPDPSQATDQITDLIAEQRRITGDAELSEEMRRALADMRAGLDEYRRVKAAFQRKLEYHAAMARKYRHVARFPWLPVEPDPPEPLP